MNQNKILLTYHHSNNRGTAHYFKAYLSSLHHTFYVCSHPFKHSDNNFSELRKVSSKKNDLVFSQEMSTNFLLDLIRNFLFSFKVSITLGKKVKTVYCFGSFNVIPFLVTNLLYRRNIFFWGVDYSPVRFGHKVLDRLYLFLESLSCIFSYKVISVNSEQENIRINHHFLKKDKSLLLPNGIERTSLKVNLNDKNEIILFYLGSLTENHGVKDFVDFFYCKNVIPYKLHIVGGGVQEKQVRRLIENNNLSDKVFFHGYLEKKDIELLLVEIDAKVFGIAPYKNFSSSHVGYGDSLKIKEYLNYNIPFVTDAKLVLDKAISEYGITYADNLELLNHFQSGKLNDFTQHDDLLSKKLEKYYWDNIFSSLEK